MVDSRYLHKTLNKACETIFAIGLPTIYYYPRHYFVTLIRHCEGAMTIVVLVIHIPRGLCRLDIRLEVAV